MNDFIARELNEIYPLNSVATIHFRNNNRNKQNNNNTIIECDKAITIVERVYQAT